jgi:hypothetical protein
VLIAAVVQYQSQIRPPKVNKEKNLVICQPIQFAPAHILPSDFAFIRSVLEEAALDFSKMSEDFKYISSDFTITFLTSEIDEAISLGIGCRIFYSLRPLLSLQLRLASAARDYKQMAAVCGKMSTLYGDIRASLSRLSSRNAIHVLPIT